MDGLDDVSQEKVSLPTGVKEAKRTLRREMLALRDTMTAADVAEKSLAIAGTLLASRAYREAACLYVYVETRGEVTMQEIRQAAWRDGKRVAVPKVEGRDMTFYYITCEDDLEEGFRGIREPRAGCEPAHEEGALMLLPGVAYDRDGNRMGYGGGFYDRYLAAHSGHVMAAPAYDCQIREQLPVECFDCKVPWIVTETREYGEEVV